MFHIILSFLLAVEPVQADADIAPTNQSICTAVMTELAEAVSSGLLTESEALIIGMNCLNKGY